MPKSLDSKTKSKALPQEIEFIQKNIDYIAIFSALIFSFLFWRTTINIPYFWDSAGFVIGAARNLLATNFQPLIPTGSDFAHPPLFIGLLAFFWKIFGETIPVSHTLNFIFLPVLLVSTYYIGKIIKNWQLGLTAMILIATTPVVLAEYGIIYLDLPMAALLNCAIAFWLYRRYLLGSIILSLAVLIKLPAILSLVFLLALFYLNHKFDRKLKTYFPIFLPFFILFSWLIYHQIHTGWFYKNPTRATVIPSTLDQLIASFSYVGNILFFRQGRWVILFGLTSILSLKFKKIKKEVLALLIFLISGFSFFFIFAEFTDRYGIFLLPALYASALYLVFEFCLARKQLYLFYLFSFSALYFFYRSLYPTKPPTNQYTFAPPSDLTYQDMIDINLEMSQFLEKKYFLAEIYGSWPENYQLEESHQGYVKHPLNFNHCQEFNLNPNLEQIIILHPYSPGQMECRLLMDKYQMTPIDKKIKNGTWLEIYQINQNQNQKELAPNINYEEN